MSFTPSSIPACLPPYLTTSLAASAPSPCSSIGAHLDGVGEGTDRRLFIQCERELASGRGYAGNQAERSSLHGTGGRVGLSPLRRAAAAGCWPHRLASTCAQPLRPGGSTPTRRLGAPRGSAARCRHRRAGRRPNWKQKVSVSGRGRPGSTGGWRRDAQLAKAVNGLMGRQTLLAGQVEQRFRLEQRRRAGKRPEAPRGSQRRRDVSPSSGLWTRPRARNRPHWYMTCSLLRR